jgi:hypothetical protein
MRCTADSARSGSVLCCYFFTSSGHERVLVTWQLAYCESLSSSVKHLSLICSNQFCDSCYDFRWQSCVDPFIVAAVYVMPNHSINWRNILTRSRFWPVLVSMATFCACLRPINQTKRMSIPVQSLYMTVFEGLQPAPSYEFTMSHVNQFFFQVVCKTRLLGVPIHSKFS